MNRNGETMKFKKLIIFLCLVLLCTPAHALNLSRVKTWGTEILTAADLNAEFNNILNHSLTKNDLSATAGILGTQVDFAVAPAIGATTPAAGAFSTLSASGATTLSTTLSTTGISIFKNKVSFTQTDNLEYIDSLASGYLDFEATTGLRFRINATEQLNLTDGVFAPTTDNDIDLGSTTKEYKDLFIDGTANIDSLVADTADINAGTFDGIVGGTTPADGSFTTLSTTGKYTAGANEIEGSAFDINGGAIDGVTIGAAAAPTVTDLGSVTTADINGGTLDGVTIGTETLTGMLIVNDASDDADGLGSQGTTGQMLISAGAGANPTWATPAMVFTSATSWTTTTNSGNITIAADKIYKIIVDFVVTGADCVALFRVNSDGGTTYDWSIPTQNEGDGTALSPVQAANTTEIILSNGGNAAINTGDRLFADFTMKTSATPTTERMYLIGQVIHSDEGGSSVVTFPIGGRWEKDEAITSFEIVTSTNSTGTVYLYTFNQS